MNVHIKIFIETLGLKYKRKLLKSDMISSCGYFAIAMSMAFLIVIFVPNINIVTLLVRKLKNVELKFNV